MYGYGYLSDPPKNPRPKRFFARICESYRRSFKTFMFLSGIFQLKSLGFASFVSFNLIKMV